MSLLEKQGKALDDLDMDSLNEIYHDDYEFTLHSAGRTLNKKDVIDWIAMDDVVTKNFRILYENDEIGVTHAVVKFKSDENIQGVMSFFRFKDGKLFRHETGASNLPKEQKMFLTNIPQTKNSLRGHNCNYSNNK